MSTLQRLIRREARTQQETLVGRALDSPRLVDFDTNSIGVWVQDVEIGSNRPLRDVPIKAGGSGNRFFAQRGQTVLLRRSAQGRYEVIGPGDRDKGEVVETTFDLTTSASTGATNFGFTTQCFELDDYEALSGPSPSGVIWNDGVTPLNFCRIIDAQGTPV